MSAFEASPDQIIASLTRKPRKLINISHNVNGTIVSTALSSCSVCSSIGILSRLPRELLWMVLDLLDFQTLSRMSRTSRQARNEIEMFPAYRDLIKYASSALIALCKTRLITFHTAHSLYAALTAVDCVYCQQFGPCLYLPTCERCCYNCLGLEHRLRLINLSAARQCFGLPKQLPSLPIFRSIPGYYQIRSQTSSAYSINLVSVKEARALAIAHHGSKKAMLSFIGSQNAGKSSRLQTSIVHYLNSPVLPNSAPSHAKCPTEKYCGMGAVDFPVLRLDRSVEEPHWCLGCQSISRRRSIMELPAINRDEHAGSDYSELFSSIKRRARSREEFLDHIKECEGAKRLLQARQ